MLDGFGSIVFCTIMMTAAVLVRLSLFVVWRLLWRLSSLPGVVPPPPAQSFPGLLLHVCPSFVAPGVQVSGRVRFMPSGLGTVLV